MSKPITKKELVELLVSKEGISKKEAKAQIDNVFDVVFEALKRSPIEGFEPAVSIHGFGKFYIKESAPRMGRNPQTGEDIMIEAANRVRFKPAKALKEAVK